MVIASLPLPGSGIVPAMASWPRAAVVPMESERAAILTTNHRMQRGEQLVDFRIETGGRSRRGNRSIEPVYRESSMDQATSERGTFSNSMRSDRGFSDNPLLDAFSRKVRDRGRDEALWSRAEGLRLSFSDLDQRAAEREAELRATGIGSVAALATGNCVAFVESYLALRRLGVTVLAMDGALKKEDKVAICRELGVRDLLLRDRTIQVDPGGVAGGSGSVCELPDGIGLVKLTSGSTGRPTGACFTDEVLYAGIRQIAEGMDLNAEQRVLLCIPLSHSYGFDNGVLSLLVPGTPLILQPSIFPADLLRAFHETDAHFLPLVPPLVRSLGRAHWPEGLALRRVICAGGALLPEAARRFHEASGLPVHNFYGSTETGGITFEVAPEQPEAFGTVGRPLPGVRVEFDPSRRVTVHSAANLVARWGPEGVVLAGPGPVRTGDTAEWTPDGRLRLTGRTADILNIGGRKIAAAEVEAALCALPGVRDAAVVGVDDAARGDRTVAFLVADQWPLDTSAVPPRLTPRELRRVDSLPHTSRGKLDRQALRRLATGA